MSLLSGKGTHFCLSCLWPKKDSKKNRCRSCGSQTHPLVSDESRAKMKSAHLGLHHSAETCAKMSATRRGRPFPGKDRNRLGDISRGRHPSAETRTRMSVSAHVRPPASEETRRKISLANTGDKNRNWKGGITKNGGYVSIRIHPRFYVLLHRQVMSKELGRELRSKEEVHHINRNRTDNRISNLALCSDLLAHRWCDTAEARIFFG